MIRLLLEDGKLPSLFHYIQENLDPSSRLIPTYEIFSATNQTACLVNSVAANLLHSLVDCDQLVLVDPFR
ncbi:hypothetical protein F0562_033550 [Nyssa sinensis]|uniref:Uncharacterized protein n=1 Tax=Nyssa sinensis TaxID=561372 RepID=A0A5J5AGI1_9ASTE|nr:hypothetical protein F0562_033550 [Nyssa sinensis]